MKSNSCGLMMFLLVVVSVVRGQNTEILKALKPAASCSPVTTLVYFEESGLCSTVLHLNSDSTFNLEFGCEGRSHLAIGKWTKSGNNITLKSKKQGSINPICAVDLSAGTRSKMMLLKVKDKTGAAAVNLHIRFQKNKGNKWEVLRTDGNGCVSVRRTDYKHLEFPALKIISGNAYRLKIEMIPDTLQLQLNTNAHTLIYPEIEYLNKSWNFKESGENLVGDNGILKKSP